MKLYNYSNKKLILNYRIYKTNYSFKHYIIANRIKNEQNKKLIL